jgi:cell division protease FtsH
MFFPGMRPEYSEKTSQVIDQEVKKLIDEAYSSAYKLIESHRQQLDNLAKTLLKYETLDAGEVKIIIDGGVLDKPTVTELLAAELEKKETANEEEPEAEVSKAEDETDCPESEGEEGEGNTGGEEAEGSRQK